MIKALTESFDSMRTALLCFNPIQPLNWSLLRALGWGFWLLRLSALTQSLLGFIYECVMNAFMCGLKLIKHLLTASTSVNKTINIRICFWHIVRRTMVNIIIWRRTVAWGVLSNTMTNHTTSESTKSKKPSSHYVILCVIKIDSHFMFSSPDSWHQFWAHIWDPFAFIIPALSTQHQRDRWKLLSNISFSFSFCIASSFFGARIKLIKVFAGRCRHLWEHWNSRHLAKPFPRQWLHKIVLHYNELRSWKHHKSRKSSKHPLPRKTPESLFLIRNFLLNLND